MTDGEIEDAGDLPPELLRRASVRLFSRVARSDIALASLSGPARVTAGDSIVLELDIQRARRGASGQPPGRSPGGQRHASRHGGCACRPVGPPGFGSPYPPPRSVPARTRCGWRSPTRTTASRGPTRGSTSSPWRRTPGVVLLAAPGDWDSRFLYRTLRDVAQLPVRGFVRLDGERWRSMEDLSPMSLERVRQASRGADLLILKGDPGSVAQGSAARGIWCWPAGERGAAPIPGDWYLSAPDVSPVAGAFLGMPVDSFPPATQLVPLQPGPADWVGLTAQLGRRGAARPAVIGRQAGRARVVTVGADGLWRWAFRGGSSEQSYRTWVATTASWLLTGVDTVRGVAAPVRPVVQNGRPLVFEWTGSGPPVATPVVWSGAGARETRTDTLRFDGAGRAPVRLAPGEYRYRLVGWWRRSRRRGGVLRRAAAVPRDPEGQDGERGPAAGSHVGSRLAVALRPRDHRAVRRVARAAATRTALEGC